MAGSVKKVVATYLSEKKSQDYRTPSNYVVPHSQSMEQFPYYTEQEMTDVHFQLNSPHGNPTPYHNQENLDKQMIYPEQDVYNPDWAGNSENFLAPYDNAIQKEFNRTKNTPESLYDPHKGASIYKIEDLNSRTASAIDCFLSQNNFVKISSNDLFDQFFKLSDETLVHKSNNDLWKMVRDKEGNIYISRLFEDGILEDA